MNSSRSSSFGSSWSVPFSEFSFFPNPTASLSIEDSAQSMKDERSGRSSVDSSTSFSSEGSITRMETSEVLATENRNCSLLSVSDLMESTRKMIETAVSYPGPVDCSPDWPSVVSNPYGLTREEVSSSSTVPEVKTEVPVQQEDENSKKSKRYSLTPEVDLGSIPMNSSDDNYTLSTKKRERVRFGNTLYRIRGKGSLARRPGWTAWRCIQSKCSGLIYKRGDEIELRNPCSSVPHKICEDKIKAIIATNKAKSWLLKGMKVRGACTLVMNEADQTTLNALPVWTSFYKSVSRANQGRLEWSSYPIRCDKNDWWLKFGGDSILLFNDSDVVEHPEGIIVLGTQFGLRAWNEGCGVVYGDGQFKKQRVVTGFQQVYTWGTVFEGCYVTSLTVFLAEKTEKIYMKMLSIISSFVNMQHIKFISIDCELAAIHACESHFPNAKIAICYFHYCQSILKQADAKGLSDEKSGLWVRAVQNLATLPVEHVRPAFDELLEEIGADLEQSTPEMNKFLSYVQVYYVGRWKEGLWKEPVFKPEWWSVFERVQQDIPLTNNYVEVYHATFGRECEFAKTLFTYVNILRYLFNQHRARRAQLQGKNLLRPKNSLMPPTPLSSFLKDFYAKNINSIGKIPYMELLVC